MSDLVAFLRARLDEDEALARDAPPGPWYIGNAVDPTQPCSVHTFPGVRLVADGLNWLVAEHIARQNPARALADIEAKRRLLKLHGRVGDLPFCMTCDAPSGVPGKSQGCDTLRLLATPYAHHPDYRAEWRVGEDPS